MMSNRSGPRLRLLALALAVVTAIVYAYYLGQPGDQGNRLFVFAFVLGLVAVGLLAVFRGLPSIAGAVGAIVMALGWFSISPVGIATSATGIALLVAAVVTYREQGDAIVDRFGT